MGAAGLFGVARGAVAAIKFGGDVDVLVAGENAGTVAPEAAKISGVRKVLKAEGESLRKQTAEAMEALVVPMMAGYDAVFIAAVQFPIYLMPTLLQPLYRRLLRSA
mgnify:CR=1 FL=1